MFELADSSNLLTHICAGTQRLGHVLTLTSSIFMISATITSQVDIFHRISGVDCPQVACIKLSLESRLCFALPLCTLNELSSTSSARYGYITVRGFCALSVRHSIPLAGTPLITYFSAWMPSTILWLHVVCATILIFMITFN